METFNQESTVRGMVSSRGMRPFITLVAVVLSLFLVAKTVNEFRYPVGNNTPEPLITVSGYGEVYIKPDVAIVTFSVTEEASTVAAAQDSSAKKINQIMGALKEQGIEEKDIKTTNYNIYPRYEYPRAVCTASYCPPTDGKRTLAAYVVTEGVTVKIRDLSKAGILLSALGELGATDVSGLSFEVDDDEAVKTQAREKAIADARAKAEEMADALGVRLVKVVGFSEDNYYPPVAYRTMATEAYGMGGADVSSPVIAAGENLVTSNVHVIYEIR